METILGILSLVTAFAATSIEVVLSFTVFSLGVAVGAGLLVVADKRAARDDRKSR